VNQLNLDLVNQVTKTYLLKAVGSEAARLRFLAGVWEIQSRIDATERPYRAPSVEAAREALAGGKPIFYLSAPTVPVAEYADAVARVARYTSEMAGLSVEQAEALRVADFTAVIDEERLAAAVNSPEAFVAEAASQLGARSDTPLTPATVAFVLVSALVPFLTGPSRIAVEALGESRGHAGHTGHCPVCGAAASMGRMGETTQLQGAERVLWCGMCHAEWGYERLRCVRCGSQNPDMLRYTHLEEDSAHRVHLCDECHGYARFVFVDDLGMPVAMVVEEAVAATLDAVALELGYTATGNGGKSSC
jgi:FdhE protein